jgi:16S rRNA (uracil1498-N3)-methyltransferase
MSSQRFFIIDGSPSKGEVVSLGEGESRHLFNVVRTRPGDEVVLLDGKGGSYRAVIRTGGMIGGQKKPSGVTAEILSVTRAGPVAAVDIAVPIIKSHRMDFAVEKCAELGVRRLIPFRCERSVWKGGEEKAHRKEERLERKVAAACKQSGNPWLTMIEDVASFQELIGKLSEYGLIYLADPGGRSFSRAFGQLADPGAVIGIVGPEGGFTEAEMEALGSAGAVSVSLGLNRLRSETSAFLMASGMILCKKDVES